MAANLQSVLVMRGNPTSLSEHWIPHEVRLSHFKKHMSEYEHPSQFYLLPQRGTCIAAAETSPVQDSSLHAHHSGC